MKRMFALIDLYEDNVFSKMLFNITLHGAVDNFILAQHIFKKLDGRMSINFKDLYQGIIDIKNTNIIKSKYHTFALVEYYEDNIEFDNSNKSFQEFEIYENDFIPFDVYKVNDSYILSDADIFNINSSHYLVKKFIRDDMSSKDSLPVSSRELTLMEFGDKLNKFDHFKYLDYEVMRLPVKSMDDLSKVLSKAGNDV